jgi:hypothetical protein
VVAQAPGAFTQFQSTNSYVAPRFADSSCTVPILVFDTAPGIPLNNLGNPDFTKQDWTNVAFLQRDPNPPYHLLPGYFATAVPPTFQHRVWSMQYVNSPPWSQCAVDTSQVDLPFFYPSDVYQLADPTPVPSIPVPPYHYELR